MSPDERTPTRASRPEGRPEAVTWGELLRSKPMEQVVVPVRVDLDRDVTKVRLISDLDDMQACRPGTVAVLQPPLASAAWAIEIAVRYAWERSARAVVAQVTGSAAEAVTRLAERLSVSVGFHDGDPTELALDLSALVARPGAVRSGLLARCAVLISEATSVEEVMTVLAQELPRTATSLRGPGDRLLAGCGDELPPDVLRVPLAPLDVEAGRSLTAALSHRSVAWNQTVTRVLQIARAQVVACEASGRVAASVQHEREGFALARVLAAPPDSGPATALGWPLQGPLTGAVVLPLEEAVRAQPAVGLSLRAAWAAEPVGAPPAPYLDGWALWAQLEEPGADPAEDHGRAERALAARAERLVRRAGLGVDLRIGVGLPGSLAATLEQAMIAARAATATGSVRGIERFSTLGSRELVTATDAPHLRRVARETLAALLGVDDRDDLVRTLLAYLDCAGSTSRAAERLAVHRNTVTGRLDRVRRLGVPVDDPDRSLELHLLCHVALSSGLTG
ncbi:helix-turn-helix domain-containing protein [uncultured Pseudokineococcus sp.]|uniref:helix-turn-helix domain-containing protein n=1 Tax=uncultured Pseudokineococcus sp. TaxID=1642928 RepID=UPI00263362C3|nr:helix-turn-helix domain-containing protein [uncultured Pseudokineococcus sp.]